MADSPFFNFILRELDELRRRLALSLGALLLVSGILFSLPAWQDSWALRGLSAIQSQLLPAGVKLAYLTPLEPMVVAFKFSLAAGALLCLPLLLWHFLAFTAPALEQGLRGFYVRFVLLSALFLAVGVSLTYRFVLPMTMDLLIKYGQAAGGVPMITFDRFYSFSISVLLAFGALFEVPLLMAFLLRFNLVAAQTFRAQRLRAFGVFLLVAQFATPDPLVTPLIFTAVGYLLYELGIWMGGWL